MRNLSVDRVRGRSALLVALAALAVVAAAGADQAAARTYGRCNTGKGKVYAVSQRAVAYGASGYRVLVCRRHDGHVWLLGESEIFGEAANCGLNDISTSVSLVRLAGWYLASEWQDCGVGRGRVILIYVRSGRAVQRPQPTRGHSHERGESTRRPEGAL